MWNDANKDILNIVDKINRKEFLPLCCPVCGKIEAHIYFYRWKCNDNGSVWVWCSACKSSAHERMLIPIWWENASVLDENLLGVHPDMLERRKVFVDEYINMLMGGKYPNQTLQVEMLKESLI